MDDKRSTVNALYIAKALGRKGYATEGTVEDENAYLRELQERATQMNQPVQPQQPQTVQPATVTDYLRQGREKLESFSPFRIGEAVGRGASEGVQKYFDRPYGYTEQERQNYPRFTAVTEEYVPYVQRLGRQFMYPFHAIVPGVQEGVTQAVGQFGGNPDLARQIGREAGAMTEWGMSRGDIVSPRAPSNVDAIPRGGEVLPPARVTAEQPARRPTVIDQATDVTQGERPALPEPQRALPAPQPEAVVPQEVAPQPQPKPQKQPKPPAPEPVREMNPLGFYSRGLEVSSTLQPKGSYDQFYGAMRSVPKPELEAFKAEFEGRPSITREEVMDFFRQNAPRIEETVYGIPPDVQYRINELQAERKRLQILQESGNMTPEDVASRMLEISKEMTNLNGSYKHPRFGEHTMNEVIPGASNYREIVLRNPLTHKGKTVAEWEQTLEQMRQDALTKDLEQDPTLGPEYDYQENLRFDPAYQQALKDRNEAVTLNNMHTLDTHWPDKRDVAHARVTDRSVPSQGYVVVDRHSGYAYDQFFKTQEEAEAAIDNYPKDQQPDLVVQKTLQGPPEDLLHLDEAQFDYAQQLRKHGYAGDEFEAQVKKLEDEMQALREQHDAQLDEIRRAKKQEVEAATQSNMGHEDLNDFNNQLNLKYRELLDQMAEKYNKSRKEIYDKIESLPSSSGFRMGPFGKSDEAMPLLVRRMLWEAAQGNKEGIIVTPASEHLKRWGTDGVVWAPDRDYPNDIIVGYKSKISKSMMDQFAKKDPNKMEFAFSARSQRDLYMKMRSLSSMTNREAYRLAEKIWKQVESGNKSGSMFPRAEGFEYAYQKMLKNEFRKALEKELGVKADIQDFLFPAETKSATRNLLGHNRSPEGAYIIRIPQEVRDLINKKGFRSYSEGGTVEMADGGRAEFREGGYPVIDLETQVPEKKWYEPFDLETQAPGVGPYKDTQEPQRKWYEPIDLETNVPGVGPYKEAQEPESKPSKPWYDWSEQPEPAPVARRAPSPMAYAPPQPSQVGNTALQAIKKVAPEAPPASSAMTMPLSARDFGLASDISKSSRLYNTAPQFKTDPSALVFHHTAGRGNPQGVMAALNSQGYGVHYIIDRDGGIHQSLPNNRMGIHTGVSTIPGIDNRTSLGVELIANHDEDVTPAQIEASRRLYSYLQQQYPQISAYGHGELSLNRLPTEGYRAVMAIRGPEGKWNPSGGRAMPNVPISSRTLNTYRTGQYASGGNPKVSITASETLDEPKEQLAAPQNVQWRVESAPNVFDVAPSTQPQGQNVMPGTLTGSMGTPLAGGRLSAYGGVNPQYIPLPKSPVKNELVFPTYGVSWQKSFKKGGTVTDKALMVVSQQAKRRRGRPE